MRPRRPPPPVPLPAPGAFLGAAVVPFAVTDDRLWVLLGEECTTGEWSPFGGRAERGETAPQTGLRELWEESLGVLGRPEHLAERGRGWWARPLCVARQDGFTTFALPMPFAPEQQRLDPFRFLAERRRVQEQLRGTEDAGACPFLDKAGVFWADADQVATFRLRRGFARDWPLILAELRRRTANWRRPGGVRGRWRRLPSPRRPDPQEDPRPVAAAAAKAGTRRVRRRSRSRSRSRERGRRRR